MPNRPSTEVIWTHLSSDLRRFIRRRVADDHAADDLLQETFVRVHRNIGTLQEADRLAARTGGKLTGKLDQDRNPRGVVVGSRAPAVRLAGVGVVVGADDHRSLSGCPGHQQLDILEASCRRAA